MANTIKILVEYVDEDNPNQSYTSDNTWKGLDYITALEIQEKAKSILDDMLAKGKKVAGIK